MSNILKTTFILSLLTILVVFMGDAFGGQGGMIIAFLLAAAINFDSYWYSDKIVLWTYNTLEISREKHPLFYGMNNRLAARAGITLTAWHTSFAQPERS